MEAFKLMVGDWIETPAGKFAQVTYINCTPTNDKAAGQNRIGWGTKGRWINAINAKPIPLTDGILRANDFTPVDFGNGYYKHPQLKWFIRVGISTDIMWSSPDNEYINIGVQYVHELQQALRLCGLWFIANELTIKPITL